MICNGATHFTTCQWCGSNGIYMYIWFNYGMATGGCSSLPDLEGKMNNVDLMNDPSGKLEVCLHAYRTCMFQKEHRTWICHAKRWPTPLVHWAENENPTIIQDVDEYIREKYLFTSDMHCLLAVCYWFIRRRRVYLDIQTICATKKPKSGGGVYEEDYCCPW